ncbi:MAG: arsenate reductase (azurin) small subunit [Candidatus Nitrospinota bacterium M3_3B_026]
MSEEKKSPGFCANRREFLLSGGATAALVMLGATPKPVLAKVKGYPKKKIGSLRKLKEGKPITFTYPDNDAENILVKLGEPAGGGVGPKGDVVAFNTICTHMGGDLTVGGYRSADKAVGPCPFHLSTFDLTRHGMIISGHGTESLPQIDLELDGDDIYAVGVMGLLYGRHSNLG